MIDGSLELRVKAELEIRRRAKKGQKLTPPASWDEWLRALFPAHFSADFSARHRELWGWLDEIEPGIRPRPIVAIWGRGGAKSTTLEAGVVRLGARKIRKYCWYVSGTQEKADSHVANIAALLESQRVSEYYPDLSRRKIGKYGASKGWRRERLRTESGLTVDALGLDTSARGIKIEDQRPDLIILDDIDELYDPPATTKKKIAKITKTILPSGSPDCAVVFIQNLIHPDSIASQLVDGRADFLSDRRISGPHRAIDGLTVKQEKQDDGTILFMITGGRATWAGQNLQTCQGQINTWGYTAFMQEAQHEVELAGGIWNHIEWQHVDVDELPDLVRVAVWVDPAVTSTDHSDSMGISAGGVDEHGKKYGLYWWEDITSPENAIERAIVKALELGAPAVGIETDQGGDTWKSVYARAGAAVRDRLAKARGVNPNTIRIPRYKYAKAGAGHGSKIERNAQMLADYERGKVCHVRGTHTTIERALKRFPNKPLDVADSWFWCWYDLDGHAQPMNTQQPAGPARWNKSEAGATNEPKDVDDELEELSGGRYKSRFKKY